MLRVLISDSLEQEGINILKQEPEISVDVQTGLPEKELMKLIAGYEALIIRSGTKVTRSVIEAGKRLKVIGRAGVGLDNVDVEAASEHGVIVMNTPGGNTVSTAEHTMSLILSLARNIPQSSFSIRQGKWERKQFLGVELCGKTLGVIGLGRIGSEVAKRAMAFGMKVTAYDPYLSKEKAAQLGIDLATFEELLTRADFITIHTPLTTDTQYLFNEKTLQKVKRGVRIINCARGGIIDEKALAKAIQKGQVAGAALDVFEEEPPSNGNSLLQLDQVIATPHLGASTEEAQIQVAIEIANQVRDVLLGRAIVNAVNMPCVAPEVLKEIRPYLELAEKLGSLEAQLVTGPIHQVVIRYAGEVTHFDLAPVTVAVIKGILTPILGETVNYVNATLIAGNRGIKVIETKSTELKEFANFIAVEVETDQGRNVLVGTLFTRNDSRIVRINNFHVDAIPSGYMLVIQNLDKPGVVGHIGAVLGKNNINIAGMTFGRNKVGGEAVSIINVDSEVPIHVQDEIRQSQNILGVKLVKL